MAQEIRCVNCIVCPMSCEISVTMEDGKIIDVSNFACPRGKNYAMEEVTAPKRMLTSTVKIKNAFLPLLPVVSSEPLPKGSVASCADALRRVTVAAPVKQGDVIVKNICGLGADIVASRSMAVLATN